MLSLFPGEGEQIPRESACGHGKSQSTGFQPPTSYFVGFREHTYLDPQVSYL